MFAYPATERNLTKEVPYSSIAFLKLAPMGGWKGPTKSTKELDGALPCGDDMVCAERLHPHRLSGKEPFERAGEVMYNDDVYHGGRFVRAYGA
jgi:hypothetical protein